MIFRPIVAAAFLLLCSLATAQQRTFFLLQPPSCHFYGAEKLAVLDFTGQRGKVFSDRLMEQLMISNRGLHWVSKGLFGKSEAGATYEEGAHTNIYHLVERNEIERILKEQRFSNSGLFEDAEAAKLGKLLGVDAIVIGTTDFSTKSSSSNNGCRELVATTTVTIKVLDVNTAQVLCITNDQREAKSSACNGDQLATATQLADKALEFNAEALANFISPHFRSFEFRFEKIKVKELQARAKKAEGLIDLKDFSGAYSIYHAIHAEDPYNVQALANMAFLLEAHGNFHEATKLLEQAVAIDQTSYQQDLNFAKAAEEQLAEFHLLGVHITPGTFDATADVRPSNTLRTKGDQGDRHEVHTSPENASNVVARIPGGLEYTVLQHEGDWYQIQLIGDKQGWLHADQVKR